MVRRASATFLQCTVMHRNTPQRTAMVRKRSTTFCKTSTQNAPKCAIYSSEVKNFWEGHSPFPRPVLQSGGENTKMKHNNQYNYRLLQSAKYSTHNAPKCTVFHAKSKKFSGESLAIKLGETSQSINQSKLFITRTMSCTSSNLRCGQSPVPDLSPSGERDIHSSHVTLSLPRSSHLRHWTFAPPHQQDIPDLPLPHTPVTGLNHRTYHVSALSFFDSWLRTCHVV